MGCVLVFFIKCTFDGNYFKFWEALQGELSSETTFDFCEFDLCVFHCEKI